MSVFLYDIFLQLYCFAAHILSYTNPKAKKWTEGRKKVWDELNKVSVAQEKRIWFHCSSLGEYEQALPLIEQLSLSQGNSEIIITFFSPSGYEAARRKNPERKIFYLPHDSKSNSEKFIHKIQPELVVFVRYDLWYHYLSELKSRQIPVILISAVFRQNNIYFKWYGSLFREMLRCFSHLFVQDEKSKEILAKHGFTNVTKAGDTRVDRVAAICRSARPFPVMEKFKAGKKIFVIGSLEPKDEPVVLPLVSDAGVQARFKFIIAPHNTGENYLSHVEKNVSVKTIRLSESDADSVSNGEVLIVDGIGMLSGIYRYADIVYIGGGFGEGLHNVLEPAAWGKPIFFGPKHHKFIEAAELTKRGGAFVVNSSESQKQQVIRIGDDENALRKSGKSAADYVREYQGATSLIYNWITQNTNLEK